MATSVNHRGTNIVTLDAGEPLAAHCTAGDMALVQEPDGGGWWIYFVAENGQVDTYDVPFDTYNEALGSARAAAEFDAE